MTMLVLRDQFSRQYNLTISQSMRFPSCDFMSSKIIPSKVYLCTEVNTK